MNCAPADAERQPRHGGRHRSSSKGQIGADDAAPTILTSRPAAQQSGYPLKEQAKSPQKEGPGLSRGAAPPHGCCGRCEYRHFSRGEAGHASCHDVGVPRMSKRRTAISAEAFGSWNDRSNRAPCAKACSKCEKSQRLLREAFVDAGPPLADWVRDLGEDSLAEVVAASRGWHVAAGDELIVQGEQLGDRAPGLYILESGKLNAYKQGPGEAYPGKLVMEYARSGDVIGELAILYSAPRAATVVAACDSYLWSVDRHTMTSVKLHCMEARRSLYDELLRKVRLLEPLTCTERAQVIDNLVPRHFREGEVIIQEGDEGNEFYLLERGEARAEAGGVVKHYSPGSCFGELALLHNQPRAASVVAVTKCKCACLDRESFDRLLGPLESLCQHSRVAYEQVEARPVEQPAERDGPPRRQSRRIATDMSTDFGEPPCSRPRCSVEMSTGDKEPWPRDGAPATAQRRNRPPAGAVALADLSTQSGTPPLPDYCASHEDRLCYDSSEGEIFLDPSDTEEVLKTPTLSPRRPRVRAPAAIVEDAEPPCAL